MKKVIEKVIPSKEGRRVTKDFPRYQQTALTLVTKKIVNMKKTRTPYQYI